MSESKNIGEGLNPFKPTKDLDVANPEKFQKALRVEKGDEAGEKGKRKKPQELAEEEDEVDVAIPVPQGLFKDYMKEDDKGPSVLDPTSGAAVNFKVDGDENIESSASLGSNNQNANDANITIESDPTKNTSIQFSNNPKEDLASKPESSIDPSKPFEKDPLVNKDHETKADDKKPLPNEENVQPPFALAPIKESSLPVNVTVDILETEENVKPSKKAPLEIKDVEKERAPFIVSSSEALSDKHKGDDKKDSQEKEPLTVVSPLQDLVISSPTGIAALQTSPFSNMASDVFTLYEKMVGMMTVQKETGKSTTVVTLNMKGSVFDKCELVLEHYDTAPHSYNVQFLGNPESVAKFAKSLNDLNNAVNQSKLSFSIHLLPPKLSKNYITKISSTHSDKEEEEENSSEKNQE